MRWASFRPVWTAGLCFPATWKHMTGVLWDVVGTLNIFGSFWIIFILRVAADNSGRPMEQRFLSICPERLHTTMATAHGRPDTVCRCSVCQWNNATTEPNIPPHRSLVSKAVQYTDSIHFRLKGKGTAFSCFEVKKEKTWQRTEDDRQVLLDYALHGLNTRKCTSKLHWCALVLQGLDTFNASG